MFELDESVKANIDKLFTEQRAHAISLRSSTCEQRLAVLDRFEKVFRASFDKIYQAAAEDFAKPEAEVDTGEILTVLAELKYVRKHLKRWMKATPVRATATMLGTRSKIINEPRGTSLIISPWNYPFNLSFGPMIWSIAAGNTVILKPSEMTPAMSQVISEIVSDSFNSNLVSVVQGDAAVARYLTQQPFDHIFFTGSPAVGKQVMAEAAKNLSSVTLELGGKSPVVIDSTADLKKAAHSICFGKFANNGQTCIAPDYIYVHQSVKQAFLTAMANAIDEQYGNQQQLTSNSDYCRIVNGAHFQRIRDLIDSAIDDGASIYKGGECIESQRFIAPTILTDINPSSEIMQQEIFGPVLPVLVFSDIDSVIAEINSGPKPLALYVFSKNTAFSEKVIEQTSAGDSAINATVIHILHQNLPFGGVNNSGIGKVGGLWGYQAFSHQRSIVDDKLGLSGMLSPPYTPKVTRIVKSAIRFLT